MTDIVERLWQSDEASALTNEAAREIERLRKELEDLQNLHNDLHRVFGSVLGQLESATAEIGRLRVRIGGCA